MSSKGIIFQIMENLKLMMMETNGLGVEGRVLDSKTADFDWLIDENKNQ